MLEGSGKLCLGQITDSFSIFFSSLLGQEKNQETIKHTVAQYPFPRQCCVIQCPFENSITLVWMTKIIWFSCILVKQLGSAWRGRRRFFVGLASPSSALLLQFLLCRAQLQTLNAYFCWCPKWLSLGAFTCCEGWRLRLFFQFFFLCVRVCSFSILNPLCINAGQGHFSIFALLLSLDGCKREGTGNAGG